MTEVLMKRSLKVMGELNPLLDVLYEVKFKDDGRAEP